MSTLLDLRIPEEEEEYNLITIFGNPGVGKTTLASRLGSRSALITTEKTYVVLKYKHPELWKTIIPIRFKGLDTIRQVITAARKEDYDQIILDPISGMVTQKMIENVKNVKLNRYHDEIPAEQDYLLAQQQWSPVLKALGTIPDFNITLISHLRPLPPPNPKRPTTGETTRPDLPNAVFKLVNQYSAVVACMERDHAGNRQITTKGTNTLTAKDQLNPERSKMSDDDFVVQIRKIRGLD